MAFANLVELLDPGYPLSIPEKLRGTILYFIASQVKMDLHQKEAIAKGDVNLLWKVALWRDKINNDIIKLLGKQPLPDPPKDYKPTPPTMGGRF